jgi:hypothetical protein
LKCKHLHRKAIPSPLIDRHQLIGRKKDNSEPIDGNPSPKMSTRSAVAKIDWTKLTSALSLTPQTTSSLTSFRKRNVDAHTKLNALRTSRTEIDFGYYRSVLKNQKVIDQIEKAAKEFKPVTYDVGTILKGIDAFEGEAVKNAQETEKKISEQLVDLEKTIKNIEQARGVDDLSVLFSVSC